MASLRHIRFQKQPYQLVHAAANTLIACKGSNIVIYANPIEQKNDITEIKLTIDIDFQRVSMSGDKMLYVDGRNETLYLQDLKTPDLTPIALQTAGQILLPTLYKSPDDAHTSMLWIERSKDLKSSCTLIQKDLNSGTVLSQLPLSTNLDFHELSYYKHANKNKRLALITSEKDAIFWHENKLSIVDPSTSSTWLDISAPRNGKFFAHPTWIDQDQLLYVSHNEDSEGIYLYNLKTKISSCLFSCSSRQQISRLKPNYTQFSKALLHAQKRQSIFFVLSDAGKDSLLELCLKTNKAKLVDTDVSETFTKINRICLFPSDEALAIIGSSKDRPESLFSLDLSSPKLNHLDSIFAVKTNPSELICYGYEDDDIAPIVLHTPAKKGHFPLLVLIHSGPYECSGFGWAEKASYFNQLGYAVAYINYAGSSAYGLRLAKQIYGKWSHIDCQQIAASITYLKTLDSIDQNRIVLWGGDLGASTIINTITRYQDLVCGAICVYPILDLSHYAQTDDRLRAHYIKKLVCSSSNQNDESKALKNASPLNSATKLSTPILLFYGDKDTVVPQDHYDAFTFSASKSGCLLQAICLENEGHQWTLEASYKRYYVEVERFLKKVATATTKSKPSSE